MKTNMKKVPVMIFWAVLLTFPGMLQAAYQFNVSTVVVNNIPRQENYLTFDGKTDMYLKLDSYAYDFGYYEIGSGDLSQGTLELISGDRRRGWGYLGSFDENDRIGIWYKPRKYGSYVYTSTNISQWSEHTKFVGSEYEIDTDDDDDEVEVEFVVGSYIKRDDGEWEVDGFEFDILAPFGGVNEGSPNGQPLPGSVMSLLIAGAFVAGWFYLEKRDRVKIPV